MSKPKTTNNWKEIQARLDERPDADERRKLAEEDLHDELTSYVATLADVRRRRGVKQVELAELLGVAQNQVSNIERQQDMLLSTVHRYVVALGGELQLVVTFPNGDDVTVVIDKTG